MPLAAVVGRDEVMESVHPGGLGGTYGANPVSCAAALAVLDIFNEEDLLGQAQRLGEQLSARLAGFKERFEIVGDVRGIGPMQAMELVKDRHTKEPAPDQAKALGRFCFEKGLVILTCGRYGNVVRLLMPLVITDELLERGLAILEEGLASIRL
jgi:4-aminobutyrate aminotransferase/(S)-3-amino-2-methylpropionate transaminase